ncbi:probable transcription factor At1g66420 [Mercurialis annua]|uniref:probable transcription factor At1g66420 n=1 Tax=Mercurialis annua TaxID=3986 RepID=UPI00215EFB9C|nr:probable transcription factor At1g66420 [Mercurialis annua]
MRVDIVDELVQKQQEENTSIQCFDPNRDEDCMCSFEVTCECLVAVQKTNSRSPVRMHTLTCANAQMVSALPPFKITPEPTPKTDGMKRASEVDVQLMKKKTKNSENIKKWPFERVWSEDDEIILLEGMIEFFGNKGVDPTKNIGSFFYYIIQSLHFDPTITRFKDKVMRMKKKFERHIRKNGKEMEIKYGFFNIGLSKMGDYVAAKSMEMVDRHKKLKCKLN